MTATIREHDRPGQQPLPVNRATTADCIVDELKVTLSHSRRMDRLLPGLSPTGRGLTFDSVVVDFRDGRITFERLYWGGLSVHRKAGG
jgi:carboxymethylenebutenolidase